MNRFNHYDNIILGRDCVISTDSNETGRNNHVLVIGGSGSGKTHSVVEPTLMEANETSLVVSDPKGRLIRKYSRYFEEKGYGVLTIDFANPEKSPCGYDPVRMLSENTNLLYDIPIRSNRFRTPAKDQDIMSLSNLLVRSDPNHKKGSYKADPFWDDMSEVTLTAFLAFVMQHCDRGDHTLKSILAITDMFRYSASSGESAIDRMFNKMLNRYSEKPFCCRQYDKVKQMPEKTVASVFSTLSSYFGRLNSAELFDFMTKEETISPLDLLHEKTVLFVQCSDSDSSLYFLTNVFYTQMIQFLFRIKDKEAWQDARPVRFILDDYATAVVIPDMPQWISIMRERDISMMLILQSITQLEAMYGREDARTIISNCDNMVFLRSNDLLTAQEFSERLDIPVYDLLYTPMGTEYVFLSGSYPVRTERFNICSHDEYDKVYKSTETKPEKTKQNEAEEEKE